MDTDKDTGELEVSVNIINGRSISAMKKDELKLELEKLGLKKSGRKQELAERLQDAVSGKFIDCHQSTACELDADTEKVSEATCPESDHSDCSKRLKTAVRELNDKLSHEINNLRHEIHGHLLSKSPSVEKSELAKLQDENNALKQRLSDIENRYDSLKREAETMYDENKSLMTALRLVNSEIVIENKNLDIKSSKNKGHDLHDVESSWVIVGDERTITRNNNGLHDEKEMPTLLTNERKNPTDNLNPSCSNNVASNVPANHQERNQQSNNQRRQRKKRSNGTNPVNPNPENPSLATPSSGNRSENKKLVYITGDSIIQHVQGWSLSTNVRHVAVKSFSGARIEDMEDYLKPLLRKEPDEIILHIGTNNIRDESAKDVASGVVNLITQVQQDSPTTRLTISPLLPRSDNLELNDKINEANKILRSICSSHGLTLLQNSNVDLTCLNRRGLHLNRKGSQLLSKCYSDYLNSH